MRDTTRRWIGTALAVCAWAFGLPAAAGAPTWVEVKSPNFSVYSDAGAKEARQVALQFEQVRLAFEKLWPGARTLSPRPVVILAVRDEDALKGLLPEYFARKGGLRPAGFSVSGSDKHYVALRTDVADYAVAGYNPYHLIYHEYIHVLIDLNVSRVPAWFGEGLAEFFGATIVEGGRLVIGKPLPWHIDTLREKPMFDLERLIAIEHGSPEYNEDNKAGIFYAQSWALVHMLATDPTSAGAKRLNALLALLKSGQDSQAAARGALGDLPAMDKELRSYVRRYAFRYGHVNADARLDGRGFPSRDVSAAEALALQGDFHVHRGQNAAAQPLLDQAAALDPRLALVHAARGLLAWREQGQEAALPHYQRAVELDADDFFAQAMLGQMLARQQTPDALARAEAALSKAIELNHEYAPAYERLASVIVQRGGDLERALGLARRAVALQPADADARLTVSWALQRAGRHDEALQEAQGALRVARDDAARGRVREWLDELARPAGRNVAAGSGSGARVSSGVARPLAEQQQRCDAGQLDDCAALGDRYRAGDGVSADAPRALGLYTRACDGGLAAGCVTLGWAQLAGDLGARDPAAAARAFGKACDGGVLDGCAQAGFVLAFAAEVKHDEAAAAPFLRQACEGGEGRACSGLGVLHVNGQGVKRDLTRAAALLERGCAADDAMGCLNLAALLEVGAGVTKDAVRARKLYGKACAQGAAPACEKVESAAK